MWRSKMAARWRGEDGNLNAGNRDFVVSNIPSELVLSGHDVGGMEMDHSILSIFEDRSVTSEDKTGTEEVSETLLSALTEMLDSVEDDDGTPFDTLPDTKLLTQSEHKDHSVEFSHIDTLKPKSKSPSVSVTIRIDAEKGGESKTETDFKQQSQTLFRPNDKKTEADVEVFTSSSLANLVKIMHSYCLKLHVEEETDKLRRNHALFSQEEVWRYERPSEESDEEINVVSDDELAVKEAKGEEEGGEDSTNGKLLKGVLLNGNLCRAPSSREKKRVSFGPVHVALFGESVEKGVNEKSLTSGNTSQVVSLPQNNTKAYRSPDGSAAVPQTPPSQVSSNMVEALPPKGETKAKSLSLQQYRQLRQKRQILMEKQQNYTTMWPSVSEPPQELTPILCSKGQRQDSCGPKTAQHYPGVGRCGADQLHRSQMSIYKTRLTSAHLRPHPPEARSSAHVYDNISKPSRTESKSLPPASPLPDVSANTKVIVPESKRSPVKKPTLLNSDPPNPVILPLPVSHTTSASTNHSSSESEGDFPTSDSNLSSTRHLEDIQKESSGTSLQQQSLSPEPVDMLTNQECTSLFQKDKNKFTERASEISCSSQALTPVKTQEEVSSWCHELQPQTWNLNLTKQTGLEPKTKDFSPHFTQSAPVSVPIPVQETDCRVRSASSDSGIEAPDLTSLLEQFEETQAKEESLEPRLVSAAPNVQTDSGRTQSVETKQHSTSPLTPSAGPFNPLSTSESPTTPKALENPRMSEDMDIPESLGTEVILSTQQDLPARRKNPSSKTIQIIEPRPLPSKKTHNSVSEFSGVHSSPNTYSSVSSDHDYCVPVDHSPKSAALHSRASKHNGVSENADELRVTTHDSTAAAENKKQTSSSREVNTTIKAVNKSVMQHLCKQTRTETNPSTDKVTSLLDCGATQQTCGLAADVQTAQCTLPTPPPSPPARGREKRRYRRRSPRSDSSSSSCSSSSSSSASRSPKRQKHHHKRSESSSCSSSPSRSISRSPPRRCTWSCCRSRSSRSRSRSWSQSRSRSRSWSQSRSRSRSRSPSLWIPGRKWTDVYNSRESRRLRRDHEMRIQKLKAIDERRVVYVGRICRSMTHSELRERFSQFGEVECVSLHFRDQGDHYGFVTFYNMEDAFAAIDNGSKLRRPDELPFDICFGGRRQFCNSDYADLDANRETDPSPAKSRFEDVDFDSLLKQAQRGLKR